MPRVSVIIPAYNREHFIAESIQSVLDQSYKDFEIIVVDDGSTDNTKGIVDNFCDPRIRYIHQENRGVAAARNTGIKASNGELIAFLDSDDIWLPENLETKVKLFDFQPDVGLVCSDYYIFDSNTGATIGRFWPNRLYRYLLEPGEGTRQPIKGVLPFVTLMTPLAVMVRRHVFNEVGYFDESLQGTDDWDMWIRILQRFLIGTIKMPLAKYRQHDDQFATANLTPMYQAELALLNKISHGYSLSKEDIKFIRKKLARTHFYYGWAMLTGGETTLGREKLLASIKAYPWLVRPYIYLAGSILGSRGIQTVKSWRERVKHYFTLLCALVKIKRFGRKHTLDEL